MLSLRSESQGSDLSLPNPSSKKPLIHRRWPQEDKPPETRRPKEKQSKPLGVQPFHPPTINCASTRTQTHHRDRSHHRCSVLITMRRSVPWDALRDERADEGTTGTIWPRMLEELLAVETCVFVNSMKSVCVNVPSILPLLHGSTGWIHRDGRR